jgi:hypothetical protein
LPLINQVRIVVHCPVPLLSSQSNIRNGATRGDIPCHNQKLTHYPAAGSVSKQRSGTQTSEFG